MRLRPCRRRVANHGPPNRQLVAVWQFTRNTIGLSRGGLANGIRGNNGPKSAFADSLPRHGTHRGVTCIPDYAQPAALRLSSPAAVQAATTSRPRPLARYGRGIALSYRFRRLTVHSSGKLNRNLSQGSQRTQRKAVGSPPRPLFPL